MWYSEHIEEYARVWVLTESERATFEYLALIWSSKRKVKYLKTINCPFAQRDVKALETEISTMEKTKKLLRVA